MRGLLAIYLVFATSICDLTVSQVFDLIIRDTKIIDGTGSIWFRGDIAVSGGQIAIVGNVPDSASAIQIIQGNGSYLAPGFIDSHTHDDISILESPSHEFKVVQGVTTIITGNCGFSNYPEGIKNHNQN